MFVYIPLFKTNFFSLNLVNKESESEQDSRHSRSTTQRAGDIAESPTWWGDDLYTFNYVSCCMSVLSYVYVCMPTALQHTSLVVKLGE